MLSRELAELEPVRRHTDRRRRLSRTCHHVVVVVVGFPGTVTMAGFLPTKKEIEMPVRKRKKKKLTLSCSSSLQFQPHFIEKGLDGGKQAAYALRNAILRECHNHTGDIEVHARYIANLSGLGTITRASGTVDSELTFKQFTVGFTTGMASFDFIDVGRGKERADTKIKGGWATAGLLFLFFFLLLDGGGWLISRLQRVFGGICAITTVGRLFVPFLPTRDTPHFWKICSAMKRLGSALRSWRAHRPIPTWSRPDLMS